MIEIFLIILALAYLIYASVSDLMKREVPNWICFSLIAFALAYRLIFSVLNSDIMFFVYGLIGLVVFVALGYGLYYARVFAGGDAKLLMALGPVLILSAGLIFNLYYIFGFIFLLMLFGGIWGMIFSFSLVLKNKENFLKEFKKQIKINKKLFYSAMIIAIFSLGLLFLDYIFIFISVLILIFPLLFVYAKGVEESCMIKEISGKELVEGDLLYENVKVRGKIIKPYWEGVSMEDIEILRKSKKKIKIKEGIPFVPAFLPAFLALIYFLNIRYYIFSIFL